MSDSTPPKKAAPKAKAPVKATKKAVKAEVPPEVAATETGLILIDGPALDPVPEAAAPAADPTAAEPSREDVGRRAYELWLARGGSAFENWVEAERQLRRR